MRPLNTTDPSAIGPYRLLGVLGGGGMGRVYLGHSTTGRRVAIKVVHAGLADDPAFRRRFAREVAAMRSVSPLFTAAVVDADTDAPAPWLATTYIDGPSLERRVDEDGPLAPGAVLTLAAGLAEALASIHRAGIVHRDLKPSNVLLDDTGPHIIDFGVALAADETRMTRSVVVGTPSYMAPERLHGDDAGPPSDVFSLGATLVFAATGRSLVNDGTVYQQVMQITLGRFDLSRVPQDLRPLIVRCLSPLPKDRPTASELSRILVGAGISVPSPGWHRESAPAAVPLGIAAAGGRTSRRRVLAIGGLVGVAALGGIGALGALDRRRQVGGGSGSSQPGRVLWQARSKAPLLENQLAGREPGERIVVVGGSFLVTASGSEVTAVDLQGREAWRQELPGGKVTLTPWGDGILVTDLARAWLLDGVTGTVRFANEMAATEKVAARGDNPDGVPVEIRGVAVSADQAFVHLGTATVAVNRRGEQVWRVNRPTLPGGRRGTSGKPRTADAARLVTRDLDGAKVQVGLCHAGTGQRLWIQEYDAPQEPSDQPRVGPGGPGGPGPGTRPGPDEYLWARCEGRIAAGQVVLRDVQVVHAFDVAGGRHAWQVSPRKPIATMETVGSLVVVGADMLRGYDIVTGEERWQTDLRGARLAPAPDGNGVLAATERMVAAVDLGGDSPWQTPLPDPFRDAVPDRLTVDGRVAYLTFRPKDGESLEFDVMAVALD
ncbi:MAG TPA: protein kinase [Micromonosporaceae bacterium]|nr:protein kinase [Micromonosporaceae bacterium]